MSKVIDAIGKACPIPVLMTKKEIDKDENLIITKVDNQIAVENLKKLAANTGYATQIKGEEGGFQVILSKNGETGVDLPDEQVTKKTEAAADYVVFLGKNYIGEGSRELGENLMRMFLYTLAESGALPAYLLLMNSGVKLAVSDDQAVEHLRSLEERGVNILVCGACLNYYGLVDELKIGTVSNMFDIAGKMQLAGKVISF